MNPRSRLSKIKLQTTPRRVAVSYIGWIHHALTNDEPYPLEDMVARLTEEIKSQSISLSEHLTKQAQQQAFFLIELYSYALFDLIEELSSSLQLNGFALAYRNPKITVCAELSDDLENQWNRLSVSHAAIELIERKYLGARVFPDELRVLVEHQRTSIDMALAMISQRVPGRPARPLAPSECLMAAQTKMTTFLSYARATASHVNCDRDFVLLAHLQPSLLRRFIRYQHFVEHIRGRQRNRFARSDLS